MQDWRRNLIFLWISQLCVHIGFAGAFPFVPLFIRDHLGITDVALRGFYMSRFHLYGTLAYGVFAPIWGSLGDRVGMKLMLYRGCFISALLYPLMAFVPSVNALLLLRALIGAIAGTSITTQMLIVKTTPSDRQGFALGMLASAIWGGTMAGEVVGGFIVHYFGYVAAFGMCGALSGIAGLFVIAARDSEKLVTLRRAAPPAAAAPRDASERRRRHLVSFLPRQKRKFRADFPLPTLAMLLVFLLFGFGLRLNTPYTALMVETISGPERAAFLTGIIAAFAAGSSMLSGIVLGTLADRYPAWKLVAPALLIASLMLLYCASTASLVGFGAGYAINYLASGGVFSVLQKVIAGTVPNVKRGVTLGWANAMSNFGIMFSAVFSGAVVQRWGLAGVYRTGALLILLLMILVTTVVRNVSGGRGKTKTMTC